MDNSVKFIGSNILPLIKAKVDEKQDKLVGLGTGQNIKSINGQTILGAGDIDLPAAKLYDTTGTNTDGALTQKFASEQLEALNTAVAKDVQFDTTLAEDNSSTVTLVKTTGALNGTSTTDAEIALPVASATSAGVVNPSTYQSIQDTADKVETILGASVSVADLPAEPTTTELTNAWKEATGKDEIVNGAKIFDSTNNKTWTYYSNTQSWASIDNANPTIELKNFTNEAAGQIKGSATGDGKVFAETDGTGSVLGWDTLSSSVSTNTSAITALQSDKQDTLVGEGEGQNIKTINGEGLLGTGDIEIVVPEAMTVDEFNTAWDAA